MELKNLSVGLSKRTVKLRYNILKLLILSLYRIQNFILKSFQSLLFKKIDLLKINKILIFRTGSIGDSVCALPAISSIRKNFPEARIDILTNSGADNFVSLSQLINKSMINVIIDYLHLDKKTLLNKLKGTSYDLFIQLPQYDASLIRQTRDIFIAKAIRAKYAFGWQVSSTQFMSKYQADIIKFDNERDRLLKILENNNLKSYGVVFPLGIQEEHKCNIEKMLKENLITNKDKNIALMVGAKRPQNRWPIEYFKELARYFLSKGFKIILVGGNNEYTLAEKIVTDKNVYNFCGKLKPLETAQLLKNCKMAISNDTGSMHLSYAVGTPVIAIFSSRDYPDKWFPPNDGKNAVLRNYNVFCNNCFNKECYDNKCIKGITPKAVIDKLCSLTLIN